MKRPLALHIKILIGLVVGAIAGVAANIFLPGDEGIKWFITNIAYPAGQIFLRLVFMVVIPLIFTAIALGVAELGDVRRIGRIGVKTLAFTAIVSAISVMIGVGLVNLIRPGDGVSAADRAQLLASLTNNASVDKIVTSASEAKTFVQALLDLISRNPLADMVFAFDPTWTGGGLLSVMFFAVIFGVAMSMVERSRVRPLMDVMKGLYDVVMKIIDMAMKFAPYGVAALIFTTTAQLGLQMIQKLLGYVLVVLLGLAIHQLVTYSLIIRYAAKRSPLEFMRGLREVVLTAFSTSSSNVTLPTAIRVTREKLKVDPDITNFVLTVGATANQNGTALYEGITVLFLAQFYGIDLTFAQQFSVVLLSILAGIGTAGVPGGSLPLIVLVLQSVGIPAEGIGVILGVDRVLDMSRTVVNVSGDITLAAWVDASERSSTSRAERLKFAEQATG